MNWLLLLMTFIASTVVGSFTDWYFFGVLFHSRYQKTPDTWKKYKDKKDEMKSIGLAQIFMSFSSLVFIYSCAKMGWTTWSTSLTTALTVWIMVPLPLLMTNAIFIPMDRFIVLGHALGWLVRLIITAACISIFYQLLPAFA